MALSGTYVSNIPQGTQQINNTQQPMETNFQDIYELIEVNHVPFNTANTFGRHNFVSYVEQTSAPSTSSTQMALFSQINSSGSVSLFYRYPNSGTINSLTQATSGPSSGTFVDYTAAQIGGSIIFYLGGNIQAQIFSTSGPVGATSGTTVSATQTFYFPTPMASTPFFINCSVGSLDLTTSNILGTTGLVGCTVINNSTFSLTFENGYPGVIYIFALCVN